MAASERVKVSLTVTVSEVGLADAEVVMVLELPDPLSLGDL